MAARPEIHVLARSLPAGCTRRECLRRLREGWPGIPTRSEHRIVDRAMEVRAALDMGVDVVDPPPHREMEPRYTAAEDAVLRREYPTGGTAGALAHLPGRVAKSVARRAKRLGLLRTGKAARGDDWSGADMGRLRRMWPNAPLEDVKAAFPGRTLAGIRTKAERLGVVRSLTAAHPIARGARTDDPLLLEIRTRMAERNFTATDMAEVAGIKRGSVASWFAEGAEPKLRNVRRAVEALGGRLVIEWESDGEGSGFPSRRRGP